MSSVWEEGTPSPIPTPLGSIGVSILAPSALTFCGSQCKILATPLVLNDIAFVRPPDVRREGLKFYP